MAWFTNPYVTGILGAGAGYVAGVSMKVKTKGQALSTVLGGLLGVGAAELAINNAEMPTYSWQMAVDAAIKAGYTAIKMPTGIKSLSTFTSGYAPEGRFACGYYYTFSKTGISASTAGITVWQLSSCFEKNKSNATGVRTYPVYTQAQIAASVSS